MSADPVLPVASLRARLDRHAAQVTELARLMPLVLDDDQRIRVDRALRELDTALTVAAHAAGLSRSGGGDAR